MKDDGFLKGVAKKIKTKKVFILKTKLRKQILNN
jgi:hypothetical protein